MLRTLRKLRNIILRQVSAHWPRSTKERLVLFGAINGNYYGDNARHLFEWVLANSNEIEAVWMTRNRAVYKQLQTANLPVAMINSWQGFLLLCRAQTAVFTNSMRDFSPASEAVPDKIKLLALRHGRSVKRIRFARKNHKLDPGEAAERAREGQLIQYAISTSEFISDIQEECLQIGREKHVVTGYPRNDYLFNAPARPPQSIAPLLDADKQVILYGPSWRHGRVPTQFFPFADFDETKLADFLRQQNYLLLLRSHVNDLKKYASTRQFLQQLAQASDCIRLATHDQVADVNSLLPYVHILVSDYSALYHDYLLLDRPIILIPYDYEEFEQQNGFLYDYYKNLPGPAVTTFDQFCGYVSQISQGKDPHQMPRRQLRDKIHKYQDDQSCFRVAKLLQTMLSNDDVI
jgi:CDP-glycerol glycerophosphotransferase (TagB/SpsB family)